MTVLVSDKLVAKLMTSAEPGKKAPHSSDIRWEDCMEKDGNGPTLLENS